MPLHIIYTYLGMKFKVFKEFYEYFILLSHKSIFLEETTYIVHK